MIGSVQKKKKALLHVVCTGQVRLKEFKDRSCGHIPKQIVAIYILFGKKESFLHCKLFRRR